ncbi:MAG TPA: uracil phosphoribosyltransferase, partial [Acetobacteraceae bacterium]|nr:uracil phosphoribosyltransferase [Acetobacteraceae bacterium]
MNGLTVIDHPLVRHKLTLLRRIETPTGDFRRLVREISLLMGYEVLRDLPLEPVDIQTPLEPMTAAQVSGKKLCFISILRAGNGILDGMIDLVPSARIGHVGLYRDPATHQPVEYYFKVPDDIDLRLSIV